MTDLELQDSPTFYLFANGNIMAFDHNGNQMPEYQGHIETIWQKLHHDFPGAKIELVEWDTL